MEIFCFNSTLTNDMVNGLTLSTILANWIHKVSQKCLFINWLSEPGVLQSSKGMLTSK